MDVASYGAHDLNMSVDSAVSGGLPRGIDAWELDLGQIAFYMVNVIVLGAMGGFLLVRWFGRAYLVLQLEQASKRVRARVSAQTVRISRSSSRRRSTLLPPEPEQPLAPQAVDDPEDRLDSL